MSSYTCLVCGSINLKATHTAKEMMYGSLDRFDYDECAECLSLQIAQMPDQEALSAYYPKDYYSFHDNSGGVNGMKASLRLWLASKRDTYSLWQASRIGRLLNFIKPGSPLLLSILRAAGLRPDQSVLDVGCGAGLLLDRLASIGFNNLTGIDPFIDQDTTTPAGVPIRKLHLKELQGSFDFIIFNHSFEHVPAPQNELLIANRRLSQGGRCLIRIPTPSSDAWETYGIDWVELDAPRHLTLPSRSGMATLAERSGFSITSVTDDMPGWVLASSELYRRGVPFLNQDVGSQFSRARLIEFEEAALAANAAHSGGRTAFLLNKA